MRYHKPGRVLKLKRKKKADAAYAFVILSRDGETVTKYVHVLVLEAFDGPCPEGHETRHLDGDLFNDHRVNLKWGTPSENAYDRVVHRTHPKVTLTHCPHDHELTAPNLDPFWRARGIRRCFACALTQMWGNHRNLRPGDLEWLAEAHRRYAEILHFGTPLNYRLKENKRPNGARWQPNTPW